jgi:hypothetical protein
MSNLPGFPASPQNRVDGSARPFTSPGACRDACELSDHIETWVNEGGAGGDVHRQECAAALWWRRAP